MSWYYMFAIFALLGVVVFFFIGFRIILSARKSNLPGADATVTPDKRYRIITGAGVILLALFLASFVVSAFLTNFFARFIILGLGIVILGVPAISCMALGLIRISLYKKREASK
jgi:threonine/homoserine/homoserine lactone efflux protein